MTAANYWLRFGCILVCLTCVIVLLSILTGCTPEPDGTIRESETYAVVLFGGGFLALLVRGFLRTAGRVVRDDQMGVACYTWRFLPYALEICRWDDGAYHWEIQRGVGFDYDVLLEGGTA